MPNKYIDGSTRWDIIARRKNIEFIDDPLLKHFDNLLKTRGGYRSKTGLLWEKNNDILCDYFKNKISFAIFIGHTFKDKKFTLKQVIEKRKKSYKYIKYLKEQKEQGRHKLD